MAIRITIPEQQHIIMQKYDLKPKAFLHANLPPSPSRLLFSGRELLPLINVLIYPRWSLSSFHYAKCEGFDLNEENLVLFFEANTTSVSNSRFPEGCIY